MSKEVEKHDRRDHHDRVISDAALFEEGDGGEKGPRYLQDVVDANKVLEENKKLEKVLRTALANAPHTKCVQPLLKPNMFDRGQKDNTQIIPQDSFRTLLELCPGHVFMPESGDTPLHMAVRLYKEQSIDYDLLFSVIECLVARCPESIFSKTTVDNEEKTAYRLLKEIGVRNMDKSASSRFCAEELFKKTCIGFHRKNNNHGKGANVQGITWAEKKEFLYWDVQSRKLSSICKLPSRDRKNI